MPDNGGQSFELPKTRRRSDLFSTQATRDDAQREKVQDIPLALIDDFPDHPYPVEADEEMQAMAESVRAIGIHTPALVRPKEDGRYELVSGHRRKMACQLAEREFLPCIVREMTPDEAIVVMVDSNLQREKVPPCAKGKAFKMKLDALNRQGKRTDLISVENQPKLRKTSRQIVAEDAGESQDKIRAYVRLTFLVPALQQLVDVGKIAFRIGEHLSYLQENEQVELLDAMQAQDATPSPAQAIKMKQFSQEGKLTSEVIQSIMMEEKPNQRDKITFSSDKFKSYFKPGTPVQTMEQTIIKALELYRKHERKREGPGL